MMIIQRGSLRTKNKTCSKEYSLREYKKPPIGGFFCLVDNQFLETLCRKRFQFASLVDENVIRLHTIHAFNER